MKIIACLLLLVPMPGMLVPVCIGPHNKYPVGMELRKEEYMALQYRLLTFPYTQKIMHNWNRWGKKGQKSSGQSTQLWNYKLYRK